MIITITGIPGAGKSTLAKMLSKRLAMPWFSMGMIRGQMAQARGMTIDEFNALGEKDDSTDKAVDAYHAKLEQAHSDFIVEGRMSWHFLPNSLKIFLDVDENEQARRIFTSAKEGSRLDEEPYTSIDDARQAIAKRLASDQKRYKMYYGVDYLDHSNYDLVIDTTDKTPEQILELILKRLDEKH
jgi:cytidylate kinase